MDGYYVTFWRLLLRYPELLAWEMLWTDSLRETYAAIYENVKSVKPAIPVGWHIWHNNSFNPIYRAEQDLARTLQVLRLSQDGDVPQLRRRAHGAYVDNVGSTLYGDLPKQSLLDFHYRVMGFKEAQLRPDSPHRTLRRLRLPRNQTRPGRRRRHEDADLARHRHRYSDRSQQQQVHSAKRQGAVSAAFRAGAPGVLLSRKYSEMRLANLSGAGDAIRELKL